MKKYILTLAALALCFSYAIAQNLYIDEVVEVPQGGQAKVAIKYETGNYDLKALQFKLELPEGITVGMNSEGETYEVVDAKASKFSVTYANNGWNAFSASTAFSADSEGKGTFMNIFLAAAESLAQNSTHQVTVKGPMVSRVVDGTSQAYYLDDFTFTVKIVENVTVLDENSTTPPEAATGVKVKVQRTITGGNWSTICLPFAMSEAQVAEAFGAGVELADFQGYDYDEDANSITVNFSSISSIAANHPCIIKVSSDISEFGLEDVVDIDPSDNLVINKGTSRQYQKIVGTYVAEFDFYNESKSLPLFLSGNKFWYASESTHPMKAFRAYFDFKDEIDTEAGVKMQLDGIVTDIQGMQFVKTNGAVYTIDGKKMNSDVSRLPKGVYVIDGKKVAIK